MLHSSEPTDELTADAPIGGECPDDHMVKDPDLCEAMGGIGRTTLWRWRKYRGFPLPDISTGSANYTAWGRIRRWIAAGKGEA